MRGGKREKRWGNERLGRGRRGGEMRGGKGEKRWGNERGEEGEEVGK